MPLLGSKILVAMSGGVDSSVAAYLLKKQGHDVVGVTFQLYDYARQNRKEGKGGCCSLEDVDDARSVCEKLQIPYYVFDSREHFKKRVVDYFSESYKRGQTPNPCVACNTFIKFDELAYYAKLVGADYYATGHYAKIRKDGSRYYIEAARDDDRDQSYFLMGVDQDKLSQLIFPVGDYTKPEIRAFAAEAGLRISQKPDSMEVCFVPNNDYRAFLKNEAGVAEKRGEIVDEAGRVLSEHRGIHEFTVGQRKGLGAFGLYDHYVVRIDAEKDQVVVGPVSSLLSEGLQFQATHFPDIENFKDQELSVKIRSRANFVPAEIVEHSGNAWTVRFASAQKAVTPGQFAVFYHGNRLLGGGPILKPVAEFSHG